MANKKITTIEEISLKDKIANLLKEKTPKLFDRDPQGSLRDNLVDELAEEILNLK